MSQENEKALVVKRAKNAAQARDFVTAQRLYRGLLKDDPNNVEYLSALGNVYMQNGQDAEALPCFQNVLSIDPNNFVALNSTGAIYRRLGKHDESIEVLQRALDTGIDDTQAHYNIGFTYKDMGKYDEAIECFETVTEANPHDVLALNHLASIFALREDYEQAISIYRKGLHIDPNHPILQYNLALSYVALERYDEAATAFEVALRSRPGWREATYDYMRLLTQRNKTKAAVNLINKTLPLYPNDTTLKKHLGNILLSQFDFDEAIKTLEDAKNIDGENKEALSALADAYEKAERAVEAIPLMDKIEKENPNDRDIQKQFAHILLSAHELDKAGIKINKLYTDDSSDVQVLDLYGQYYICKKDENSAKWYFEKINELDPKYDKYINEAAERYRQAGWLDKAEEFATDYLHRHNDDSEAYVLLSRIQEAQGKHESALDLLQRSLKYNPENAQAKKSVSRLTNTINDKVNDTKENSANGDFVAKGDDGSAENLDEQVEVDAHEDVVLENETSDEIFDFSTLNDDLVEPENDSDIVDFDAAFESEEVPVGTAPDDITNLVSSDHPFDDVPADSQEIQSLAVVTDNLFDDEDINTVAPIKPTTKVLRQTPMQREEFVPPQEPIPIRMPQEHLPTRIPQVPYNSAALDDAIYKARSSADRAMEAAERAGLAAEEAANAAAADLLQSASEVAKLAAEEAAEASAEAARLAAEDAVAVARQVATEAAEAAEEAAKAAAESAAADAIQKMQSMLDANNAGAEEKLADANPLISSAARLLPGVMAMLEQKKKLDEYKETLLLFRSIRDLAKALPEEQLHVFMSSKIRMQLEYIISKLSGKPGLIATVDALHEAIAKAEGKEIVPKEKKDNDSADEIDEADINTDEAEAVIAELGMLAMSLEDKDLAQALTETADNVLQKL